MLHINRSFDRVVQLELNEISIDIIQKLVAQDKLPNFKKVLDGWKYFQTSSEDTYAHIEPWVQWVTVHTGKTFSEHNIFHLGDIHDIEHPQIWELLSAQNKPSAIVGAMNSQRGKTEGGIFFPDPWSKTNDAFPEELRSLWSLISSRVQSHASTQPTAKDILEALKSLRKFNIKFSTATKVALQLFEQTLNKQKKWKLAALFDLLLSDIFISVLKNPDFKFLSLFLNANAHYQHHFWRKFEPELFEEGINCPDCDSKDNPIEYGYQIYDQILGKVLKEVDLQNTLVIICSGLSQIPFTSKEEEGGMNYYRLKDHKAFANMLGIDASKIFPMMSRDWQVKYQNSNELKEFQAAIESVRIANKPVFNTRKDAEGYLFVETAITKKLPQDASMDASGQDLGKFWDQFINIAVKSGHHTGLGCLWFSNAEAVELPNGHSTVELKEVFEVGLHSLGVHSPTPQSHAKEEKQKETAEAVI